MLTQNRRRTMAGLAGVLLAPGAGNAAENDVIDLRIVHTSDVHTFLTTFDYRADEPRDNGFERIAGLIQTARREQPNTLVFDGGDTLQGDMLGSMLAARGLRPGEPHPAFEVMRRLEYDAAIIGNHEFDYGLPFLDASLRHAGFPILLGNIVYADGRPIAPASVMLRRQFRDQKGKNHRLNIGVIGVSTADVIRWVRFHLEGRVRLETSVEAARRLVPEIRARGADIVVLIAHSGLTETAEKEAARADGDSGRGRELAQIPGVDVLLLGHWHQTFPSTTWPSDPNIDLATARVHGTPTLSAGATGREIGLLDLQIRRTGAGRYAVTESKPQTWKVRDESGALAPIAAPIARYLAPYHRETLRFLAEPCGAVSAPIDTFLAAIGVDPATRIVHDAMYAAGASWLERSPYRGMPLITASPVFRNGRISQQGEATPFVDIPAGPLTKRDTYLLYQFENYPQYISLTVAQLKAVLEFSASIYQHVDGTRLNQLLLGAGEDLGSAETLMGVDYEIDVSQPPRYDWRTRHLINPQASRIRNLMIGGAAPEASLRIMFMVGHFRAGGGGGFPWLDGTGILGTHDKHIPQLIAEFGRTRGVIIPGTPARSTWRVVSAHPARFRTNEGAQARYAVRSNLTFVSEGANNTTFGVLAGG
jgi:2',3'-cyclic-nucleotide 2'-phosphodiesterase/3'-nucleotidase